MINVMIVGVGGQGSLLASRILGDLFIHAGLDVKMSEVHGMAQRGGSVVTYVKAGESVASPLISEGEADVIISFEELEAMRYLPWLKKGGTLVVNTQQINPMPVLTGAVSYPQGLIERLQEKGAIVVSFDALEAAIQAGNTKAANVALLGAAAKVIGYEKEAWVQALQETIQPKFLDMNLKAFELGWQNENSNYPL